MEDASERPKTQLDISEGDVVRIVQGMMLDIGCLARVTRVEGGTVMVDIINRNQYFTRKKRFEELEFVSREGDKVPEEVPTSYTE